MSNFYRSCDLECKSKAGRTVYQPEPRAPSAATEQFHYILQCKSQVHLPVAARRWEVGSSAVMNSQLSIKVQLELQVWSKEISSLASCDLIIYNRYAVMLSVRTTPVSICFTHSDSIAQQSNMSWPVDRKLLQGRGNLISMDRALILIKTHIDLVSSPWMCM